jgi:Cu-Zn family superoxide dismutase
MYQYMFCSRAQAPTNQFIPPSQPGRMSAYANIQGSSIAPGIRGIVTFTDVPGGVMVCTNIQGLPEYRPAQSGRPPIGPFGFHIHEFGKCEPYDGQSPFKDSGEHWNPDNQPHGNYAGDFPVLFSYHGNSRVCFFTDRFTTADVLGRAVIIHENPDDYRTQPSGNSGRRIACGAIRQFIPQV